MPAGTQGAMASAPPVAESSYRGAPVANNGQAAVSPPSREQLRSWLKGFGRKKDRPEEQTPVGRGIFGVSLEDSIRYANVAISLQDERGEPFIYGYVPIVVAKCGVFLKEKATNVEGIFRLSGSAKRIKDLQTIFNSPERYGKGLDWTGYTVHDAANILRRYLNQLPEPIVPLDFYERFRDPLRAYQAKVGNDAQAQAMESQEHTKAVDAYKRLITELPPLNRQLLLYILDLLAVFASEAESNRMTAQNLAAIFQPGIISHPSHDMAPNEYRLSQDVLIFLIENQDNFLIGMDGTAMNQKDKDDVKSGPPSITTPKPGLGRSASTASAGADSLRKSAGIRRNGSLSSRNSRDRTSPNVSGPGTPASPSALPTTNSSGGGLARSNTVPSNRSPAMSGHRFQRVSETNPPSTPTVNTPPTTPASPADERLPLAHQSNVTAAPGADVHPSSSQPPHATQIYTAQQQPLQGTVLGERQIQEPAASALAAQELKLNPDTQSATPNKHNTRGRNLSNFLSSSPIFGPSDPNRDANARQPRKLQKRRIPGAKNESAQSSQASLNAEDSGAFHTPMMTPSNILHDRPNPVDEPTAVVPDDVPSHGVERHKETSNTTSPTSRNPGSNLLPPRSPTASLHSRSSVTDPSDLDALEDPVTREEKRRHRYRPSNHGSGALVPPPLVGQNPGARASNTSLGSNRPRKSFTGDSQWTQTSGLDTSSGGYPSGMNVSSRESGEILKENQVDPEKKGFFGRIKARMSQSKEEKQAEKERAKSPPRFPPDQTGSRTSLSAFTHEHFSPRGRSFDKSREGSNSLAPVEERPGRERSGSKTPMPPAPAQYAAANAASAPVSAVQPNESVVAAPSQTAPPASAAASTAPTHVPVAVTQSQAPQSAPVRVSNEVPTAVPTMAPLAAAAPAPVPIVVPGQAPPNLPAPDPLVASSGVQEPGSGTQMETQRPDSTQPAAPQQYETQHNAALA